MAGALLVGCNSLDDRLDPQPKDARTVGQKISVSFAGETPASKALSDKGVKTFVAGDKISVVYTTLGGELVSVASEAIDADDIRDNGRRADFYVTLDDPEPGCAVYYVYPAAMVNATGALDYAAMNEQDGTLETLGRDLDLAIFRGQLSAECELPATGTLENSFAILEISIMNADASFDITKYTSSLTVSDGANTYVVTPPDPAEHFGDGPVYVLVAPCVPSETITFTVGNGGTREVTGKSIEAGHMYPVGLKFGSAVDLSEQTETDGEGFRHYVAKHGDVLYKDLSTGYVSIAEDAAVTLKSAYIERGSGCHQPVLGCIGDGTILLAEDSENFLLSSINCYNSAIYVPKGKTVTIGGEGALIADMRICSGAAIGGTYNSNTGEGIDCGTIIIEDGILDLYGSEGCAGIGSARESSCDGIIIRGGSIEHVFGGQDAAGIGCGVEGTCGDILISGGTIGGEIGGVVYDGAQGSGYAAGIGCGKASSCGNITIGPDITRVVAKKGSDALNHIGRGDVDSNCGTVSVASGLEDSGENGSSEVRTIQP